jgi:hypothetical protein
MEDVILDATPAPEVREPVAVPVEEETSVIDEPEPEVDNHLLIVESAEANADIKDVESPVSHETYSCFSTSIHPRLRSRTNQFLRKVRDLR